MIYAILAIASSSFFGFEFLSLFLTKVLDVYCRIGIGSSFGIIISAWIYFISSYYVPLSFKHGCIHQWILISIGALITIIRYFLKQKSPKPVKIIPFILGVIIPGTIVSWFLYKGLLYNGKYTKGAAFGDLPFHMNLISSFAYGCNLNRKTMFSLVSPFFAGEPLSYPFIPNFYSAVLIKCFNTDMHHSIVLPSYIFAYSAFIVLTAITKIFCANDIPCIFVSYLFIFSGGLGFTRWFTKSYRDEYNIDYVHQWGGERNEYWFQSLIHIMLPQRASLFSFPICWGVILILISANDSINIGPFFAAGILVGILPQVHPHSIIALAEWGVVFAIIHFPIRSLSKMSYYISNYLALGCIALLLGFLQCLPFFDRLSHNFFKIAPIYEELPGRNYLTLWWYGLGASIVLALIHVPIICNKRQIKIYIPSIIVFLLGNIIWYQPWSLDNTKIFNATFIPIAFTGISLFFYKLIIKFDIKGAIVAFLLFVFCIASGCLAVAKMARVSYPLWSYADAPYVISKFVIERTDPSSVWITDNSHINPIVCLAGRQTLVGYRGWLISHGLDDSKRTNAIYRLRYTPDDTREIDALNVSYIAIRTNDESREIVFHPAEKSTKWRLLYKTSYYRIYKRI